MKTKHKDMRFLGLFAVVVASLLAVTIIASAGSVIIKNGGLNVSSNLYVDPTTGMVGIGTTSPGAKLSINFSSPETTYPWNDNDFQINNANVSAGVFSGISLLHGGSINGAIALKKGSGNDAALIFWTNTGSSVSEKMRIDSAGNVGIGTTNPTTGKLVVSGGNIDVSNNKIINVSAPTASTDAATKGYVDAATGGGKSQSQYFTANGTFTVPTGVTLVWVTLWGGGGGGSGSDVSYAGAGGGSGEVIYRQPVVVTPGSGITVTIGAGGAGAGNSVAGSNGTSSSFGSISAAGGFGGNLAGVGGAGGGNLGGASATRGTAVQYLLGGSGGGSGNGASGSAIAGASLLTNVGGAVNAGLWSGGGGAAGYNGNGGAGGYNAIGYYNGTSVAANSGAGGGGKGSSTSAAGIGGNGGSGGLIVEWIA